MVQSELAQFLRYYFPGSRLTLPESVLEFNRFSKQRNVRSTMFTLPAIIFAALVLLGIVRPDLV